MMGGTTAPVALTDHIQFAVCGHIDSLADNTRRSYMGAFRRLARYGLGVPGDLVAVETTSTRATR